MPGVDWKLYKAQLFQESRLDPTAVSPAGAEGIAQFMPGTWGEVSEKLDFEGASAFSARFAIEAGAYYMARLRRNWFAPRPEWDRHSLAMASYNAGLGSILKAQRRCGGRNLYPEIIRCLPEVTGHHAAETQTYVPRIWKYHSQLLLGI